MKLIYNKKNNAIKTKLCIFKINLLNSYMNPKKISNTVLIKDYARKLVKNHAVNENNVGELVKAKEGYQLTQRTDHLLPQKFGIWC